MTEVRDFSQQERVATVPLEQAERIATNRSVGSNTSANLKRRMGRSNTIKTYHDPDQPNWEPGAEPGVDTTREEGQDEPKLTALYELCTINITDISEEHIFTQQTNNQCLKEVLGEPRPDDMPLRWISVSGISWDVIKLLANKFGIHRLAVEDLLSRTRTKVDWYSDHAVVILTLQKLVRVCTHEEDDHCDCDSCDDDVESSGRVQKADKPGLLWWMPHLHGEDEKKDVLPTYQDSAHPNTVKVHDSTSPDAPIKYIRTLHRYEGAHNPEHVAFMEKHSALAQENLVVSVEQVAIFLMSDNTVISFFEHSGPDVESPILERLESQETMLRRSCDASLLMESIIDAVVDLALPIKDAYNNARKEMQIDVLTNPDIETSKSLYIFSEEVDMLQNLFKPIVHLVNALRDHQNEPLHQTGGGLGPRNSNRNLAGATRPYQDTSNHDSIHADAPHATSHQASTLSSHSANRMYNVSSFDQEQNYRGPPTYQRDHLNRSQTASSVVISPLAHTYLGDVLDHCLTHIQSLEQMDASANNLSSLIFNTVGANTNNFMMILALVTVFFSPLTFISGYFGMNFARMDSVENHSDVLFWIIALPCLVVFMGVVSGKVIWDSVKSWTLKAAIKKMRRSKNKKRAAGFGAVQSSKTGTTTGLSNGNGSAGLGGAYRRSRNAGRAC